jgi:Uma2 family endonuclease
MTLAPALPRRLFTGAEVMRMVETGILSKNDKIELIEGDLIEMPPQGPPHAGLASQLHALLFRAYGSGVCVRGAAPLDCGKHNLPEPDLAVVRGAYEDFMKRHPAGDEALLVVEVARTSHTIDRVKTGVYARAGVSVYWLIDLPARRIEIHEQPQPDGSYALVSILKPGDSISPPGTSALWTLDGLLPEP